MSKDEIYRQELRNIEDFRFDKNVSDAFDDMVDRSVPGYRTLLVNLGPLAEHFVTNNSNCYDLGCSHGAAALSIYQSVATRHGTIIAVDNSAAMLEKCQKRIIEQNAAETIQTQLSDIQNVKIENASFVILNLTLQFIPIEQRSQIISNIQRGLNQNGACILTEKMIMQDAQTDLLFEQLHEKFKSANQYSQLEISQKRKALENVLVRENLATHKQRLIDAGFSYVRTWFQCMNFISLLAVK